MEWKRITINIEPHLAAAVAAKAKKDRRSVSAYMANLIERELYNPSEHAAALHAPPLEYTAEMPKGRR